MIPTEKLLGDAEHIHKANPSLIRVTAQRQHYSRLAQPLSIFLPPSSVSFPSLSSVSIGFSLRVLPVRCHPQSFPFISPAHFLSVTVFDSPHLLLITFSLHVTCNFYPPPPRTHTLSFLFLYISWAHFFPMFFLHLLIIVIYITCLILAGFVLHSSSLSSSSVHHCCSQNFVDDVIFLTTTPSVNLSIICFFLCVSLPVPSTLLVFPLLTVTAFLISSCLFIPLALIQLHLVLQLDLLHCSLLSFIWYCTHTFRFLFTAFFMLLYFLLLYVSNP